MKRTVMSCSRPAASSSARPPSISWDDLRFENTDGLAARILSRKTTAAEGFIETVRLAGELVGGRAFSRGHDLERLYRDVQGAVFHPLPRARQTRLSGRVALGLTPVP